jgi:hypothetical protein
MLKNNSNEECEKKCLVKIYNKKIIKKIIRKDTIRWPPKLFYKKMFFPLRIQPYEY